MSATLSLTEALLERRSVTPADAGCQELMTQRLAALGFECQHLPFGEVSNFWARLGRSEPLLVFAGHTDVVPAGPLTQWHSDPFRPTRRNGQLFARGAADMKAALAAMVVACERFLAQYPHPAGSLGFLVTSDEEGPAQDGTVRVVEWLRERGEHPQYCLVGEPSSRERLGDMAKNGRRGSLHGHLRLLGVQGHVAYPHLAENPIHGVGDIIRELSTQVWDQGDEFFPPTSFQISNIQGGTGAVNVIPGEVDLRFNLRFSPAVSVQQLRERVETIIQRQLLDREVEAQQRYGYELDWHLSGMPFITRDGALLEAVAEATREVTGLRPEFSTTGGTSDGRFIAPLGTQVVELGHVNSTIHKINECVDLADVERLTDIYERLLVRMLAAR